MRRRDYLVFSYLNMRKAIGLLGIFLPFLVAVFGFIECGFKLKGSISAYYYTNARDVYIAALASIAIFLLFYRGYEKIDDIATNLSGIFALGTLVFPTYYSSSYSTRVGLFLLNDRVSDIIHTCFAASLFFTLAFISIVLFTRSRETGSSRSKRARNRLYAACGIVMVVSIVLIIIYLVFLQDTPLSRFKPVLFLESISLFAFGISWLFKGKTFMKKKGAARGKSGASQSATTSPKAK